MSLVGKSVDTRLRKKLLILDKYKDYEESTDFVVDFYLCQTSDGEIYSIKPRDIVKVHNTKT